MKTSSILENPISRLVDADSPNLEPVSKFYSNQLVRLVKDVLQGIPGSVFDSVQQLTLYMDDIPVVPSRFERDTFRDYAQVEPRRKVTSLISKVTILAESILSMEKYLIGVAEIRPREILEEGLSRELLELLAKTLNSTKFTESTPEHFQARVQHAAVQVESIKEQLVKVQDFIKTAGLAVFNRQSARLVECYTRVELGCIEAGCVSY